MMMASIDSRPRNAEFYSEYPDWSFKDESSGEWIHVNYSDIGGSWKITLSSPSKNFIFEGDSLEVAHSKLYSYLKNNFPDEFAYGDHTYVSVFEGLPPDNSPGEIDIEGVTILGRPADEWATQHMGKPAALFYEPAADEKMENAQFVVVAPNNDGTYDWEYWFDADDLMEGGTGDSFAAVKAALDMIGASYKSPVTSSLASSSSSLLREARSLGIISAKELKSGRLIEFNRRQSFRRVIKSSIYPDGSPMDKMRDSFSWDENYRRQFISRFPRFRCAAVTDYSNRTSEDVYELYDFIEKFTAWVFEKYNSENPDKPLDPDSVWWTNLNFKKSYGKLFEPYQFELLESLYAEYFQEHPEWLSGK